VTGESGTSAPTVTCLSYREITDFLDMFLGVICEKEEEGYLRNYNSVSYVAMDFPVFGAEQSFMSGHEAKPLDLP